jgi:hypothetical protein
LFQRYCNRKAFSLKKNRILDTTPTSQIFAIADAYIGEKTARRHLFGVFRQACFSLDMDLNEKMREE